MTNPISLDSNLRQRFLQQFEKLWPAIKGSLAEVRKPCIRPNCPACAKGDKHPAFILSFTDKGRRRCMYVPAQLVPQLRQALRNGKTLEALPYQLGPELLRQYRSNVLIVAVPWTPRALKPAPLLTLSQSVKRSFATNWNSATVVVVIAHSPPDPRESLPKVSLATNCSPTWLWSITCME